MSQSTGRSSERSGVLAKLVPPLVFLALCVLAVGAYYVVFVSKKMDYLTSRNFRYLAMLGEQTRQVVEGQGRVFKNLALKRVFATREDEAEAEKELDGKQADVKGQEREPSRDEVRRELAPRFREVEPRPGGAWSEDGALTYVLTPRTGGAVLELFHRPSVRDKWAVKQKEQEKAKEKTAGGKIVGPFELRGEIDLAGLVEPLFGSHEAFESILIADAGGRVVFQTGGPDLSVTDLRALLDRGRGSRDLDSGSGEGDEGREGRSPRTAGRSILTSASDFYDVELSGRDYRLFVEPVSLPVASSGAEHAAGATIEPWLICGLVSKNDMLLESLAVSPVLVATLLGVLLLALLTWPFVKLQLLGDKQRVRVYDVLLLGLCGLLGVSVLTLLALDAFAYEHLKQVSISQLERFGDLLERNVRSEVLQAHRQLLAFEELSVADFERDRGSLDQPESGDLLAPKSREQHPFVLTYPFTETFSVLGRDGFQKRKWGVDHRVTARIKLDERPYFRQVSEGETWWLEDRADFVLEQVVSWGNGRRFVVLARPAPAELGDAYTATLLAIPMLSLIDPVLPPGFEFAVVDREGRVVFHSDAQRNDSENFFLETDRDRRLRSAVFARRPETLSLRYWGEDYMGRVVPVEGLPWTIVALREKSVIRSVNVEMITSTLSFLLVEVSLLTLAVLLVVVTRPSYRASWLWPNAELADTYVELAAAYALLAGAFLVGVWRMPAGDLLIALSWMLPFLAILAAYLKLGPSGGARRRLAEVAGVGLAGVFLACLWRGCMATDGAGWWWGVVAITAVLGSGVIVATGLVRRLGHALWQAAQPSAATDAAEQASPPALVTERLRPRYLACRWYPIAGLGLLSLASVFPIVGLFKTAHGVHLENLVKHGQLHLAKQLEARAISARRAFNEDVGTCKSQLLDDRLATRLDLYASPFFETEVVLPPYELARVQECEEAEKKAVATLASAATGGPDEIARLPRLMAVSALGSPATLDPQCCRGGQGEGPSIADDLLPRATEHSAEAHELLHRGSGDGRWHWRGEEGALLFESREYPGGERGAVLRLRSAVPRSGWITALRPSRAGVSEPHGARPAAVAGLAPSLGILLRLLGLMLFVALVLGVVRFISRRVFLTGLLPPFWWNRKGGPPVLVRNLFLVGRSRPSPEKEAEFVCLDLREADPERWKDEQKRIREAGKPILVKHFEHRIDDAAFNEWKLVCLEYLVENLEPPVVVLSRMSPRRFLARHARRSVGSSPLQERWRRLLAAFPLIDEENPPHGAEAAAVWDEMIMWLWLTEPIRREPEQGEGKRRWEAALLFAEAGRDEALRRIAGELLELVEDPMRMEDLAREQILEEFGDRAEKHYRLLWNQCSRDERLVLEQLAEEGLVNEKSRRVVRRLMARGLVVRAPNLRVMNETFRRFVVSSGVRQQVVAIERSAGPSAWDRFRGPFFATLGVGLVFFLATQQRAFESALATVTGVAAAVPALAKVLQVLASGRAGMKGGGA